MRFITKLFAFACALTAVILVFGLNKRGERRHERERDYTRVIVPAEAHAVAAPHAVAEPHSVPEPHVAIAPRAVALARVPGEVRIMTTNGVAFLALRGDDMVAGLSDSLREVVAVEMKKEMKHESGIGEMIQSAVRTGVEKLLDKEIAVPVSEIRDIEYRDNRIVIIYKNGKPRRVLNFDNIKNDDQTLLEQFREEDARRLVDAVRVKIVRR